MLCSAVHAVLHHLPYLLARLRPALPCPGVPSLSPAHALLMPCSCPVLSCPFLHRSCHAPHPVPNLIFSKEELLKTVFNFFEIFA